jgi:hypothetical protein
MFRNPVGSFLIVGAVAVLTMTFAIDPAWAQGQGQGQGGGGKEATEVDCELPCINSFEIEDGTGGSDDIGAGQVGVSEIDSSEVQRRVTGTCTAGSSIREIAQDGTVTCETDDVGGAVGTTLSDLACTDGEFARYNFDLGDWVCDAPHGGPLNAKIVFLTHRSYTGNLGGIVGADFICQAEADFWNVPGRFRAWISSDMGVLHTPGNRFLRVPDVPYVMLNGQEVFPGPFTGVQIAAVPIKRTPGGSFITDDVWTNTTEQSGIDLAPADCDGWTSSDPLDGGQVGNSGTTVTWTNGFPDRPCSETNRLYCFQQ